MPVSIGIDLGGHNIKTGLVRDGNIIRRSEEKTISRRPEPVIEQIARMAKELGACKDVPLGVGIAGGLDAAREKTLMGTNFDGWNGLPIRSLIEQASGAPTKIENDANAYALGESFSGGAAEGLSDYVLLTLGTGIGGGIISGGKIFSGAHGLAGELGHIVVGGREKCGEGCGGIGHLEAFCGADALEKKAITIPPYPPFNKGGFKGAPFKGGKDARPDMKELWEKRADNKKFWDEMLDNLAKGVATIIHILDPQAVIFGGGLSRGEGFLDALRPHVIPYLGYPYRERLDLRLSLLGNDAAIIGAAAVGALTK